MFQLQQLPDGDHAVSSCLFDEKDTGGRVPLTLHPVQAMSDKGALE
jgi:hypothetical protein